MAADVGLIDWTAPWLAPWHEPGQGVAADWAAGRHLPEALNAGGPCPVRFVAQDRLPAGIAYEAFIADTGCVPTREHLHDFFNGLVWLRFPRAKGALNRLQAAELAARGVGPVRGPVRDAITVLDENGALLWAPDVLWDALAARQWGRVFGPLRPCWARSQLVVFGHGALEQLVRPFKSITVHVWRLPDRWTDPHGLDAAFAATLQATRLAAKPFVPLPVLGVPGWWPANEDPAFYDDPQVFRPARAGAAARPPA